MIEGIGEQKSISEVQRFLINFLLDHLPIAESVVLKSPSIIGLLSISPFLSVNICFIHLGALMLGGAYVFVIVIFSFFTFLNIKAILSDK